MTSVLTDPVSAARDTAGLRPSSSPLLCVSVPTAAAMLSISKSLAYELVKQGRIPTIRLSGHLRVPVRALEQVINELAAEGSLADGR